MSMTRERVLQFTRQNTGSSLCDSGGAYGYGYNVPVPPPGDVARITARGERVEPCDAFVCVTELLQQCMDEYPIFRELIEKLPGWADSHETWHEAWERILVALGYREVNDGDNTYNYDSDFDQCLNYHVWSQRGVDRDYIYSTNDCTTVSTDRLRGLGIEIDEDELSVPDILTIVQVHTGCDVRGGYSDPIFGAASFSAYTVPVERQLQWWVAPVKPETTQEGLPDIPQRTWEDEQDFESTYEMENEFTHIEFVPEGDLYGHFIVVERGSPEPAEGEEDARDRYIARFDYWC